MVATVWSIAVLSLASLSLPAAAAPTRTQCRCTVVDARKPWSSSSVLRDSSRKPDLCAHLGPEIEYFRHAEPEVYETYFEHMIDGKPKSSPTQDDLKPMTTKALMELASKNKLFDSDRPLPSAPTERPRERIVCRSVPMERTEYHDSARTIFGLGVIVALAVLACLAECINVMICWMEQRQARKRPVRLSGSEKKLLAFPSHERIASDPNRVYIAYVVDIDDEDDMPVL